MNTFAPSVKEPESPAIGTPSTSKNPPFHRMWINPATSQAEPFVSPRINTENEYSIQGSVEIDANTGALTFQPSEPITTDGTGYIGSCFDTRKTVKRPSSFGLYIVIIRI